MLIIDLWGINFKAVIVFGLGKNLLFKSILGHGVLTTPVLFLLFYVFKNWGGGGRSYPPGPLVPPALKSEAGGDQQIWAAPDFMLS